MSCKNEFQVFVVDPNSSYRKIIIERLRALGFKRFKTFECGEQCFTDDNNIANLIVLEHNLGNGNWNGVEFMEEYKRKHNHSVFLFMSSNTSVDIAVESIRLGAHDYILKSKIGLSRLIHQVEKLAENHRQ